MKFKNLKNFVLILMVVSFAMLGIIQTASAADILIDSKVKSISFKKDKNGNDYARIIILESKELNGVKYSADTMIMAFQETVQDTKILKPGDPIKAVVAQNEYRGRMNYNLIQLIKQ